MVKPSLEPMKHWAWGDCQVLGMKKSNLPSEKEGLPINKTIFQLTYQS